MDSLRERFATMTPEEIREASRERELEEWRAVNRFCGKCGAAMRPHENPAERAFVCPRCGYLSYPKLSPAVIVLVTKGDSLLLQRNTHYKTANWTLVAGFVDPGENLLNNPTFETGANGLPVNWERSYETLLGFITTGVENGKRHVAFLPGAPDSFGIGQGEMKLVPGGKYRFGAWVRTRNLKIRRADIVFMNWAWANEFSLKVPRDTNGEWRKVEMSVTAFDSFHSVYSWRLYAVGMTDGEFAVRDVDEDGWRRFICVEPVLAGDGKIRLKPGDSHQMSLELRVLGRGIWYNASCIIRSVERCQ